MSVKIDGASLLTAYREAWSKDELSGSFVAAALLLIIPAILLNAWVLKIIWGWYAPDGWPALDWRGAVGLMLIATIVARTPDRQLGKPSRIANAVAGGFDPGDHARVVGIGDRGHHGLDPRAPRALARERA